jgi:hypothetical protein
LAFVLDPVGDDVGELWIGIRPGGQTARAIGHRDELLGDYYVSLIEGGKIGPYRHVDLIEEYSPQEEECSLVEVNEEWADRTETCSKVKIPGLTPWKAAEHHAREWAEQPPGPPSEVGEIFTRHTARFAHAAKHGILTYGFTDALNEAMKSQEAKRG